jgi:preprotein translocase subunit YajC
VNVLFLFGILFVFMYLLLIRPQRQQARRQAEMIEALKPGDEVITAGGIFGDVVEVMDDRVSLEISEDIEIEVAKRAIAQIIPAEEPETVEAEAEAEPETEDTTETEDAAEPVGAATQEDSRQA